MSRIVATLAALTLLAACNEAYSPSPGAPRPTGITVVPSSATIHAGQVVALTARLTDENGDRLNGVTVGWRSSNDAVASVAATGEVIGRGEGHAIITASAQGKSQFSTIHVLARGSKDSKGVLP